MVLGAKYVGQALLTPPLARSLAFHAMWDFTGADNLGLLMLVVEARTSDTAKAPQCTACGQGKYQDATAATTCKNCTAGKAMAGTGAIVCEDCPPGTVMPGEGAVACNECPAGEYNDEAGQNLT